MGVALSGGRLRCLAWRNVACYGNIDFIWNIEYSWREEGGDCTDDSRSIRKLAEATIGVVFYVKQMKK